MLGSLVDSGALDGWSWLEAQELAGLLEDAYPEPRDIAEMRRVRWPQTDHDPLRWKNVIDRRGGGVGFDGWPL